jgi:sugar lactone lactonase YvrE
MSMTRVLVDSLHFPEGLRWHDGRLWFSDFYQHAVFSASADGRVERVLDVPSQPSGLGWLPDGRLLVVSMLDRRVLRREADGRLIEHADLSHLATFHCNDMLVDHAGRAYVGNFGFDLEAYLAGEGETRRAAVLARVDPDGSVSIAADGLEFPNGVVLSGDRRTLIIAETFGRRLRAFRFGDDGALSGRRVWADLKPLDVMPDGICIDSEDAVWVTNPLAPEVIRVMEGGTVLERITTSRPSFACALGGRELRSLFVATADTSNAREAAQRRTGRIEMVDVTVPAQQ